MRQKLDALITKHDLIRRTMDSFWAMFDCYLEEEPEECAAIGFVNRESVRAELYGYVFGAARNLEFDFIKVYLDVFVQGKSLRVGDYWCIYDLQGNLFDDVFVID